MTATPERPSRVRAAFELALLGAVLMVPLLGVWSASSLASYWDAPRELALVAGALLFPVLPLVWEGIAQLRRRRKKVSRPPILTFTDRLTLRTLVLSALFLLPMVWLWPAPLFNALTTRGDWFLDGVEGDAAAGGRRVILGAADGLVWLYDQAHENPWREPHDGEVHLEGGGGSGSLETGREVVVEGTDEAGEGPTPSDVPVPSHDAETPTNEGAVATTDRDEADASPEPLRPGEWPYPSTLHPLAHAAPEAEASIASLGRWYAAAIDDPTERAKAIHDWVADHVAYDVASYRSGHIPPQTAEATFTTRLSVCAGYAELFTALGRAADLTVETVVGDARNGSGEPEGHAWNAIQLDGDWYLVDTTWDAGFVDETSFTRRYRSAHFLIPPEIMGITHFPDEERWQLREAPLTRGEWNRQPILRPEFFAAGLRLIAPDRAQVETGATVLARVESSRGHFLLANVEAAGEPIECDVTGNTTFEVRCRLPAPGTYTVHLYESPRRYGTYDGVASFEAVYR